MYEHRREQLLPFGAFLRRLVHHSGIALIVILGSLFVGMLGYVHFERMSWLDGFVNAAMLLSGMGPLESPQTSGGKLFAGCYALYSGVVFLVASGLMLAPVAHRILHKFHLEGEGAEGDGARKDTD